MKICIWNLTNTYGFVVSESIKVKVLATDMDGTFIPLDQNARNQHDLSLLIAAIVQHSIDLMYVTGRDLDLVIDAVQSHGLPSPAWLICDVGTSIYQWNCDGFYKPVDSYVRHLSQIVGSCDREVIVTKFAGNAELRLQEDQKQTCFKISYYCDATDIDSIVTGITSRLIQSNAPYSILASTDPFTGNGLIDLVPTGVSKAYALNWWARHSHVDPQSIIFAGDSGNDLAALTAGYRSIVVGNADSFIAETVTEAHRVAGYSERLFIAKSHATSGVLEGLAHFLGELDNR